MPWVILVIVTELRPVFTPPGTSINELTSGVDQYTERSPLLLEVDVRFGSELPNVQNK